MQSIPPLFKRRLCILITDSLVGSPEVVILNIILKIANDSLLSSDHMPGDTGLSGLQKENKRKNPTSFIEV